MTTTLQATRRKVVRAAIYARISQDRSGEEIGVSNQIADCRRRAEQMGWTVHEDHVYKDDDISASTLSKKDRPRYNAMLRAARRGEIDAIVFYSNSRLTRRPAEWLDIIELARNGLLLSSIVSGQHDLTTADGRATALTIAAWDAAEAERTSERVKRNAQARREAKKANGGRRVFGYMDVKPGEWGYLERVDEREAKALREAARDILAGKTVWQVMNDWNAKGIRTATGKVWSDASSIRRTLLNPTIAGYLTHRGVVIGKGTWPPVLERAVQEALEEHFRNWDQQRPVRSSSSQHILSGLVYCSCGSTMLAQVYEAKPGARSKGHNRYVCMTHRGGCGKVARHKPWLEERVDEAVAVLLLKQQDLLGDATPDDFSEREQELKDEIDRLEDLNRDTQERMDDGKIDPEDGWPAITRRRGKIKEARTKLARLAAAKAKAESEHLSPLTALEVYRNPAAPFEERRAVLESVVSRIVVKPLEGKGYGKYKPIPVESIEIIPR